MKPRYVGAREANQQFSALIKQVEDEDITVVITRRGEPIVQMTRARPVGDANAIAERMTSLFEKFSRPTNFEGIDRDALHNRDALYDREALHDRDGVVDGQVLDLGSIAIDTNVVIYAFDPSSEIEKRETAKSILARAGRFPLRLPLQVAAESFRVLTHRLGWTKAQASEIVAALLADIPSLAATRESTLAAFGLCADHSIAFWDANLLSAVSSGGCGLLLTEDFQDRRRFDPPHVARSVWTLNPFIKENRAALEALDVLPSL